MTSSDVDDFPTDVEELRKVRLKEFHQLACTELTRSERQVLYTLLKEYQRRRNIQRLVQGLRLILRTARKLELLKCVRYFISEGHMPEFDRLTQFHSRFRPRKKYVHSEDRYSVAGTSTGGQKGHKDVRVFTIVRTPGEPSLGFSVRGGSEHGLGIYVSEIEPDSVTANCGLQVGDRILEVNNISFKGVASSGAVKVLTGSNRLKLVVQRTHKVPEWRLSREKTSWYDVHDRRLISGDFEECGMTNFIRGLDVDVPERRVNLKFGMCDSTAGFNVRGGKEYGLGVYVSRVDRDSVAHQSGLRIGDQIIDVNGIPFDNITHAHAVEVLKDKRHLVLTLRDVGRFPAFKELYAEYTWSDGQVRTAASMADIHLEATNGLPKARSATDLFSSKRRPSTMKSEIFLPANSPSQHEVRDSRSDDGNESLLNVEHCSRDIYDSGGDNPGFVPDENIDTREEQIIVTHVENTANVNNTQRASEYGINVDTDNQDGIYSTPDMIYAKINKTDNRATHVDEDHIDESGDSDSDMSSNDDDEYQIDNTNDNDVTLVKQPRIISDHFQNTEDGEIGNFTRGKERVQEISVTVTTEVEGALYSQVRRMSVSSPKGTPVKSTKSLTITPSRSESQERVSNEQTLLVRGHASRNEDSSGIPNIEPNDLGSIYTSVPSSSDYARFHGDDVGDVHTDDNRNGTPEPDYDRTEYSFNNNENFTIARRDVNERLNDLENRQQSIGLQQINTLSVHQAGESNLEDGQGHKSTWKNFKNKIKGSLRMKSSKRGSLKSSSSEDIPPGSVRKKGNSEKYGNQLQPPTSGQGFSLDHVEEATHNMLNVGEANAVIRHINAYQGRRTDVQTLVQLLLAILDEPEKLVLFRDIRSAVYPGDAAQYDSIVSQLEVQAYETMSAKLRRQLNHNKYRKPRKTLMKTELEQELSSDSSHTTVDNGEVDKGHFNIKPLDHHGTEYEVKDELVSIQHTKVMDQLGSPGSNHASPQRRGSRASNVFNSITDQFGYLDNESSDGGSHIVAIDGESFGLDEHQPETFSDAIIVHLSKNKPIIGIELAKSSHQLRIERIDPAGAANDDSTIKEGLLLLSVDGRSVEGCSVPQAMAMLEKSFANKQYVSMKLVLCVEESTNF